MFDDRRLALFERDAHNPSFDAIRHSGVFDGEPIDFCVPVNTYFPPKALFNALQAQLPDLLKYYPDYAEQHQAVLAGLTGIPEQCLVVANGSTELITTVVRMAAEPLATSVPTFGRWTDLPDEFGKACCHIQRDPGKQFRLDVAEVVDPVRRAGTRTLVLCNPNNPTGAVFSFDQVAEILFALRDLDRIIVDESFIDFSSVAGCAQLAILASNVVIVKSMGKSLGWHGIRLGYAVASPAIARQLRAQLPYWNINGIAAAVLHMLPTYQDAYRASLLKMANDRRYCIERLATVPGLTVYPSEANFVLVRLPDHVSGESLRDQLLTRNGLVIRECGNKVGSSSSYLRIAVRPWQDVDKLVEAIAEGLPASARML